MEGLLRRSKSIREPREKPNWELNFEPPYYSLQRPSLPSTQPSPNPGAPKTLLRSTSLRKLARRKSIASTRESMVVGGGIHESLSPPGKMTTITTITAEERKHRASMFFGLVSPPMYSSTQQPPKRVPPPSPPPPLPSTRLSPFPPRPSTAGASAGNDGLVSGPGIGVALGSPTGTLALTDTGTISFPSLERYPNSPEFQLPSTPFGVEPRRMQDTAVSKPFATEASEEAKTAGWKIKLFGKGMFSRKTAVKSREPIPECLEHPNAKTHVLTKKRPQSSKKSESAQVPSLDVDIPSVEMERYSIMFGNLLNPSEQSSLYARRRSREVSAGLGKDDDPYHQHSQPTLQVPQLNLPPLRRHATTGLISPRSPLSNLGDNLRRLSGESRSSGPHSPGRRSPLPSPRGRSPLRSPGIFRSQTTAADGRPPASPRHPPVRNEMLFPPPLTHSQPLSIQKADDTVDDQDRPGSRISRISEKSSIDTPRGSFEDGDDEWITRADEDDLEPTWEMLNPPSQRKRQSRFIGDEASPVSPDYDAEVALAAQVSIARTVSISKRGLLLPVVSEGQRVVSRKTIREPMKPRIVEHRMSSSVSAMKTMPERAEVLQAL